MTHKESQRLHALRRAWQRVSSKITDQHIDHLEKNIQKGSLPLLYRSDNGNGIYRARCERRECYPVYDYETKQICTFLTEEQVERNKRRRIVWVSGFGWRYES